MIDFSNVNWNEVRELLKQLSSLNNEEIIKFFSVLNIPKNVELNIGSTKEVMDLLDSQEWDEAVNPNLLVQSEEDKRIRAEDIVFLFMGDKQDGITFLNVGCEEGHIADLVANRNAKLSVGYDIKIENEWQKNNFNRPNLFYSNEFSEIQAKGPYDKILMYDILDHVENPIEILKQVKSVLSPNGEINIRCHPWCSRHGGHLYKIKNKAYLHLILTDEEIKMINEGLLMISNGGKLIYVNKIIHPRNTYARWFNEIGLKIDSDYMVEDTVPSFFYKNPIISSRIKKNWQTSPNPHLSSGEIFPHFQLGISFIDYKLSHK